ncbi:MAG: pirin family protein [Bacteroidia bacterium]
MKPRTIDRSVIAKDVQMGPVTLKQPVPIIGIRQVDPFLLLHHAGPMNQTPGKDNVLGVGAHPHRGFEPVTFIFKGEVHHKDSHGHDSVIKAGGVQWMTAGSGIVHSEMGSQDFVEKGGELELIQLWVNLPADLKMTEPRYQGFQAEEIPQFVDQDGNVKVNVIAGAFKTYTGPVDSLTDITAYTIRMKPGGSLRIEEEVGRNPLLYQLEGTAHVNGQESAQYGMTTFKAEGDLIEIEAKTDSLFLYVAGKPIEERIAQYGPFVMNTQDEIMQAVEDFQTGEMGVL